MAGITGIGCGNVAGNFPLGFNAIVTTDTGANDLAVVNGSCGYGRPIRWKFLVTGVT